MWKSRLALAALAMMATACVKEKNPWEGKEGEINSPPPSLAGAEGTPANVAAMSWEDRIALARQANTDGKVDESEAHYMACLSLAEKFPQGDQRFFTTLVEMSYFYYFKGRYEMAIPIFQRTVTEREKAKGAESLELAKDLQNIGNAYAFRNRLAEAEPVFKRALAIREKNTASSPADMAGLLHDYADFLTKANRPEEAEAMEKRSQALRTK